MIGLLIKDWYVLLKQLKIMLIILLIFACTPGFSMASFAVLYMAMLPVTAIAYDERSKWDELAVMMPYSSGVIVASKYVLGILSVIVASAFSLTAQVVIAYVRNESISIESILALLLVACFSLILLSVNLPLIFRMGVEKGRIAFMILLSAGAIFGVTFSSQLTTLLSKCSNLFLPVVSAILATALVVAITIPISAKMYQKRNG